MRRRSVWSRVLAGVLAPWFAIVMVEPAALHTCQVHSSAIAPAAHAVAATQGGDVTAAAGHHHDVTGATQQNSPSAPHHGGGNCTCLGGCCAASPVRIDAAAVLSWLPAHVRQAVPRVASDEVRVASSDYRLPFANAPPARA